MIFLEMSTWIGFDPMEGHKVSSSDESGMMGWSSSHPHLSRFHHCWSRWLLGQTNFLCSTGWVQFSNQLCLLRQSRAGKHLSEQFSQKEPRDWAEQ